MSDYKKKYIFDSAIVGLFAYVAMRAAVDSYLYYGDIGFYICVAMAGIIIGIVRGAFMEEE